MEQMRAKWLLLACGLLFLAGCSLLRSPPEPLRFILSARGQAWGTQVTARPTNEDNGVTVSIAATEPCRIDWGDGFSEQLPSTRGQHIYAFEGTYALTVTSGDRTSTGRVTVTNQHPISYGPFVAQASEGWGLEWRALITFDFREQDKGCIGSGAALEHYGVRDPDGDPVLIRLTVSGTDGHGRIVDYSVYTQWGDYVTGAFVEADFLYPWIGWQAVDPLAPVFPRGPGYGFLSLVRPQGCGDSDPVIPPGTESFGTLTYTLELIDPWMRVEDAVTTTWNGFLSSSPTCSN